MPDPGLGSLLPTTMALLRRQLLALASTWALGDHLARPVASSLLLACRGDRSEPLPPARLALETLLEDARCLHWDPGTEIVSVPGTLGLELHDLTGGVAGQDDRGPEVLVWGPPHLAERHLGAARALWRPATGAPPGGWLLPTGQRGLALGVPRGDRTRPACARDHVALAEAALGTRATAIGGPTPLRVALLDDEGSGDASVRAVRRALREAPSPLPLALRHVDGADVRGGRLDDFEVLVVPGGHAGVQRRTLGAAGRARLVRWVRGGGTYVGICAGAFLGASTAPWGIGLLAVEALDVEHWRRGTGEVPVRPSPLAVRELGLPAEGFRVRYANGPLLRGSGAEDVLLRFAGDLPGCAPPARSPRGAAAWLEGRAGAGRVALLSPHLEATAGYESLLGLALRRAAGR